MPRYFIAVDGMEEWPEEWIENGPPTQCRYCEKDNLFWKKHEEKWRLFDGETLHICQEYGKN
jgi:hypothetical protein